MDNNQMMVSSFMAQGYTIEASTDSAVIMIKKKKLKIWLLILLCFTAVGWAAYLLYFYAILKDERVQIANGIVTKL